MGVVVWLMFELHPLLGWLGHYRGIVASLRGIAAWFMGTRYLLLLQFVLALLYCCLVQVYGGCCCGSWLYLRSVAVQARMHQFCGAVWDTQQTYWGSQKGLVTCMYVGGEEAGVA